MGQPAVGDPGNSFQEDDLRIDAHEVQEVSGCVILYLRGRIGPHSLENFRSRVNILVETGFNRLVLHCAEMQSTAGTATGAFASLQRELRLSNGNLVLLKLPPEEIECYRLLGFTALFLIAEELDEAFSYLTGTVQTAPAGVFPNLIQCPSCSTNLRAARAGRFRCSSCQGILAINNGAQVFAS